MKDVVLLLFGEGDDLTEWQMALRAVTVFILALVLLRVSGQRALGQKTPFDTCTIVLVGAVLSRAVVGASPFWPTLAAATALVLMHRLIAYMSVRWAWFEAMVSGTECVLVRDGQLDRGAMCDAQITYQELRGAIRQQTGTDDLSGVHRAVLERNGKISIVEKPPAGSLSARPSPQRHHTMHAGSSESPTSL